MMSLFPPVLWDGAERAIPLHRVDRTPLLGMGLVFGNVLTLYGKADGEMRLEPLAEV
jgi:hypothetical protein